MQSNNEDVNSSALPEDSDEEKGDKGKKKKVWDFFFLAIVRYVHDIKLYHYCSAWRYKIFHKNGYTMGFLLHRNIKRLGRAYHFSY